MDDATVGYRTVREATGVVDRRRVRIAPVGADAERVVAAHEARQEVVRVERQAVHRTDEHALGAGPAVQAARDDQRRLDVAQFRRVEAEDEVVADVRVLEVEEQPVADHPLIAELVGRVRAGVPPVLAEARVHRALRRRGFDRVQVVGAARVALLLGEVVEERQLVALEQLDFTLQVGRLQQRACRCSGRR